MYIYIYICTCREKERDIIHAYVHMQTSSQVPVLMTTSASDDYHKSFGNEWVPRKWVPEMASMRHKQLP